MIFNEHVLLYFQRCTRSKWFTSWLGEESHKNFLGKTYQLQISFPNKPSNEVTRLNSGHPGAEVVRCDPFLLGHSIFSGAMLANWWFQMFYMFTLFGEDSILTNIFQMGWNHQLVRCREGIVWCENKNPPLNCLNRTQTISCCRRKPSGTSTESPPWMYTCISLFESA